MDASGAAFDRIVIEVHHSQRTLAEVILIANSRMKRRGRALAFVLLPMALGFGLLAIPGVRRIIAGLNAAEWALIGGLLLLLAVNMVLVQGRALGQIVEYLSHSPIYSQPHRVELDRAGVSIRAGHAYWYIPWAMIDAVVRMRDGLGLCYGGQIVPVPDACLPAGLLPDAVAITVQAWHEGKRAPGPEIA